ncbi:MAG: hypothetical protein P4M11_08730 [Candidatus Pacebacteria bacterium]|nr:hypothetical protein [Candidatus Paceibacterota bacterium]
MTTRLKKEATTVSIEGINSLEYYIKTYSQVILEFTELVQGLNNEGNAKVEDKSPPKWTLRFSVRDVAGHEGYLREGEHKNVDFINVVKDILAEDLVRPNNFQVPMFDSQFSIFHNANKKAMERILKGQNCEADLNNILGAFMQSNYEIFVEKMMKTLAALNGKYLANTKAMLDQQMLKSTTSMSVILELTDPVVRSQKTECTLVFELFCEIVKHILASCRGKRAFFNIFGVLLEFLSRIEKAFKEAFVNEVTDTHYMKQFDKNYYDFEKNSYVFRTLKYPFLYMPITDVADLPTSSRIYSVSTHSHSLPCSKRTTRNARRSSTLCCTSSRWPRSKLGWATPSASPGSTSCT